MAGPQHLGRQFHEMTQDEFAQQPGTWFHGTVHGMIDPAGTGFHVGDKAAAEEVLRSRLVSSRLDHPNTYYSPDERDLRKVVIWRKKSYGTRSARGERFVERITSVVETVKKNLGNVLSYLESAIEAFIRKQPAPYINATLGI